ncbi:hypothetical protein QR680_001032 [Steinernema hermaphroditum]|uniref:Uncharacterized protein n=1 Tax=Steinernema hermaphroditum TaxID=289476 RepID=A0AA39GXL5_9BILA|nr:hypothetical protein QR680_001032 [Steinernema hermaphroditum]
MVRKYLTELQWKKKRRRKKIRRLERRIEVAKIIKDIAEEYTKRLQTKKLDRLDIIVEKREEYLEERLKPEANRMKIKVFDYMERKRPSPPVKEEENSDVSEHSEDSEDPESSKESEESDASEESQGSEHSEESDGSKEFQGSQDSDGSEDSLSQFPAKLRGSPTRVIKIKVNL